MSFSSPVPGISVHADKPSLRKHCRCSPDHAPTPTGQMAAGWGGPRGGNTREAATHRATVFRALAFCVAQTEAFSASGYGPAQFRKEGRVGGPWQTGWWAGFWEVVSHRILNRWHVHDSVAGSFVEREDGGAALEGNSYSKWTIP